MIVKELKLQIQMVNDPPYFRQFLVLTLGGTIVHLDPNPDRRTLFLAYHTPVQLADADIVLSEVVAISV